ncbi:MAG: gluconate 2-dehydrogenase subunit 3 family protein [Terriglobia bacterium]
MANDEKGRKHLTGALTRREWLLTLGETAVLLGFSGTVTQDTLGKASDLAAGQESAINNLPAGLYEASPDHLTHALAMNERFVAAPHGSETDFIQPGNAPFHPQFFTSVEYNVVQRLVDLMLDAAANPQKASPELQALDNGTRDEIAEWIDLTMHHSAGVRGASRRLSAQNRALAIQFYGHKATKEVETADDQKIWREGIAWITEESHQRYGKPFLALDAVQQTAIVESASDHHRTKEVEENAGARLFAKLKRQVGRGYYTSRRGLEELGYKGSFFYAESPGCPKNGNP